MSVSSAMPARRGAAGGESVVISGTVKEDVREWKISKRSGERNKGNRLCQQSEKRGKRKLVIHVVDK